jgi:steroid 5-alpha reductase family enzyme
VTFFETYILAFGAVMILMTGVWIASVRMKNASIVDPFWSVGFIIAGITYYLYTDGFALRKTILLALLIIWGLRLAIYLGWRNIGKPEDYRYQQFRQDYGPERYWWFSFFQVFLLQGFLLWLVSAPLLAAMYFGGDTPLGIFDYLGMLFWTIGFIFEAGGDYQLVRFKSKPENKGKLLTTGLWKYTRHPNYFGDAALWWGFGCFSVAVGSYIPLLGPLLMSLLIIKVSGVAMLERTLKNTKPGYKEYVERTNAFIPWFPRKHS